MTRLIRCAIALFIALVFVFLGADVQSRHTEPAKPPGWSCDEMLVRLSRTPNDPYLQYLAIQLARRDGRLPDIQSRIESIVRRESFDMNRGQRTDLFRTFSGALAVQESLQLDTLIGEEDPRREGFRRVPDSKGAPVAPTEAQKDDRVDEKKADSPPEVEKAPAGRGVRKSIRDRVIDRALRNRTVPIASLTGPTIKSHPWTEMLAGRKPDVGPLAKCVPADFYLVEFKSAALLTQALSIANLWGDHIFTQMLGSADSQDAEKRLRQQLGIAGIPADVVDAMGVEGIAITGSDLYLTDGSDVTILVLGQKVVALRKWADGMLSRAKREEGKYLDIAYTHSTTPDGAVNVFAADPRPDLHVRSNSLPAFKKVLESIAGKNADGKPVTRLGETKEYAYVRTIMPRGAAEEDGIIYLSDPCIRRLVGPQVKLSQRRRLIAFNHMKMIERAALMYRTEQGRAPKSFAELADSGCAPGIFGQDKLACPNGGTYTLAADGMSATSSVYGSPDRLKPLIELPLTTVSQDEAAAYNEFLDGYNQYWRTFFDPIAVRVKVTPHQYRLETVILPLIDNSIYTGMAQALAGPPVTLDASPVSRRAILSVAARINKQPALDMLPPDPQEARNQTPANESANLTRAASSLQQFALAMHNVHDAMNALPNASMRSKDGKPLLSWRVAILPYLEQSQLFEEFRRDEPWDSEHNKKLIAKMPAIYRGRDPKTAGEGKTPFVVPTGKGTMFPPDGKKVRIQDQTDGTSNSIMVMEVTDDRAVIWTKPDDLEVDPKQPQTGLVGPGRDSFLVVMGDGAVRHFRKSIPNETLAAMFTINGGEVFATEPRHEAPAPNRRGSGPGDFADLQAYVDVAKIRKFLRDGIGDQLSIHIYDAAQPVGAEMAGMFGAATPMRGMGMRFGPQEMMMAGLLVQSIMNPACVTVPVRDVKVVDDFLDELDKVYVEKVASNFDRFMRPEYYKTTVKQQSVRVIAWKFFGMSLRICWARIGNMLCIGNQLSVLEELADSAAATKPAAAGPSGHAMLRVRPENWRAVWPVYQLGWEEGHRYSCEVNQNRISAVAPSWPEFAKPGNVAPELLQKVFALYGVRPTCPDNGSFVIGPTGCSCSIHGSWNNPRQTTAPAEESATAKTIRTFSGMTATLTFLEDGLHAVVVIDRK